MLPPSRLPHLPASLNRNKKLDTASSVIRGNPSDPSLPADTTAHHLHRAPLAQIDQQLFVTTTATTANSTINNGSVSAADLASSALSSLPRAPSESILPSRALGKPTMPRRSSYTGEDGPYAAGGGSSQGPAYRRLSQSRINPTAPYPPSKPTRRTAHTHTQSTASLSSTRRGSLPALHLHTSPQSTPTVSIAPPTMQENSQNFSDDDYYAYSSLATFSFGAASAPRQSLDPDTPSPLSVQTTSESGQTHGTGSSDRTPRPSISHTRGSDDERGEDEIRRPRAKMRAIDDGGRRPSLPTNLYIPDLPNTGSLSGPSSRRHPEMSGSDSDPIAPNSASDPEFDPGNESGIVDTDVELEGIAPDDMLQNTFGLNQVRPSYTSDCGADSDIGGPPDTQQCADWYIVDPNERRHEAGSPVIFASADSDEGEDSDVSETGSRGLAVMRRNSIAIRMATARDRSFRAQETDLRWKETSTRAREDSAATVRRPIDEDWVPGVHVSDGTDPEREGEPSLPTPNWSMFNNNAVVPTAEDSGQNVYSGINLDYIMNVGGAAGPGSRRSSHSFVAPQLLPLPPPKDKTKSKDKRKKDKSKGKETLDIAAMQGLIGPSTSPPNLLDVAPWADAGAVAGPRRPSTVTLDDSFAGGLRRLDPQYAEQRKEWSFIRDAEQVVLPPRGPDGGPRAWDVWRCAQIGKIRLERATLPHSDPDKPSQQRLNAEHDVDPACLNDLGGPTTVVHRHSRALAFSIYRHYSLRNYRSSKGRPSTTVSTHTPRSGEGRSTLVMPAHDGILLATKRVQEQFTYTKSTSRLDAHGLLPDDGDNRRDNRRGTHRQLPSQDLSADSHKEAPGPRHILDLSRLDELDERSSNLRRSQSTRTTNSSLDFSGTTAFASSAPTSQAASSASTSSASSISERQLSPHDEAEEDEDSDGEFVNNVPRTSHAEAFATLDSFAIDQIKNEQVPVSVARRSHSNWIQRFIGPASGSRSLSSSLTPINPPWMMLVPRSMQEEQDRAIQGLRTSFKDVGLVPSTRSKGGVGIGRKGKGKNKDVLTQVPDDSLYMLLPLWPHETDPASTAREGRQGPMRGLDREQNLYLLVYYVPFGPRELTEGKPTKKRSRSRTRKGGEEPHERHHPTPLFDVRRGFKVVGRLIAHADLNGSGIRLPVRGLSVTGSLAEAEMGIPPASLRDVHSDDYIIGACLDRSGTIDFVPEGLEKLGLCVPRTEPHVQLHTHPAMQTAEPVEEGEVVSQPLTAIGRAAIEVAWLGCMALTTFYGPKS